MDITARLSIIVALVVFCLVWENITSLMRGAKIWEKWENTKPPGGDVAVGGSSRENGDSECKRIEDV
jgi:hypothetical protein